jgi:hypothetical protein
MNYEFNYEAAILNAQQYPLASCKLDMIAASSF